MRCTSSYPLSAPRCTRVYTRVYAHSFAHVYTHVCMHVRTHIFTRACTRVYTQIGTHTCICTCLYTCPYTCLYTCLCMCRHTSPCAFSFDGYYPCLLLLGPHTSVRHFLHPMSLHNNISSEHRQPPVPKQYTSRHVPEYSCSANIVMAYIVMAFLVMAYIVMA